MTAVVLFNRWSSSSSLARRARGSTSAEKYLIFDEQKPSYCNQACGVVYCHQIFVPSSFLSFNDYAKVKKRKKSQVRQVQISIMKPLCFNNCLQKVIFGSRKTKKRLELNTKKCFSFNFPQKLKTLRRFRKNCFPHLPSTVMGKKTEHSEIEPSFWSWKCAPQCFSNVLCSRPLVVEGGDAPNSHDCMPCELINNKFKEMTRKKFNKRQKSRTPRSRRIQKQ